MVLTVTDSINRTGIALLHEPEAVNTGDLPPRSAEILWNLAMERKKNSSEGKLMSNEVIAHDITGNLISLQVPEHQIRTLYPALPQKGNTKPAPLLHPAQKSETPLLSTKTPFFVPRGDGRSPDTSK